ncbi:putative glycerol-1-phosphate prenyltransferase [Lewinella marina]|uniref:Geranylgeranylglyceryl phosphate synthase n=1 Tax=Neolewinella marina TaxID=438751 RepID=A0A2G0CK90_9BACT|nr:geranylgeranylglyceryl/heptaprenylglyceryl phosphate synthase [Neolewinella marina]NJB84413.1 putative glycerol-1-phosphate prenyltransferase [Neolewinella marina]PHL00394.1 geranylgeranylglyceryl/heptaprenylglyceryl phosphate synthase [Neolewinella marina]
MILSALSRAREAGRKLLAVLVDPDKATRESLRALGDHARQGHVDFFLWGGSLVNQPQSEYYLRLLKAVTEVPVLLFPGSVYQLDEQADGLLLLSLISGRNPELLIGHHVTVAGRIKRMGIPTVPTGYLLIDGGKPTSVSYMSGTTPIPADKPAIAAATALAGEQLGLRLIYLDAGSGALHPVHPQTIRAVRTEVDLPLVVGGGIRTPERAREALEAGADLIVVGNGLEGDHSWLPTLAQAVHACGQSTVAAK